MVINIVPVEREKYGRILIATRAKFRFIKSDDEGGGDVGYSLFDDNNEPAEIGDLKMSPVEYQEYNGSQSYLNTWGLNELNLTEEI